MPPDVAAGPGCECEVECDREFVAKPLVLLVEIPGGPAA